MILCFSIVYLQQAAAPGLGPVPHPTLPVSWEEVRAQEGERPAWSSKGAARAWVALQPSWCEPERPEPLAAEEWRRLQEVLADEVGWSAAEGERWAVAAAPRPVPLRYRLTREDGGEVLLAGVEPVWPGRAAVFAGRSARNVVADLDVEIAQSSAIADPVEALQWSGVSLAVEVLPVPAAGWQVEVALTVSAFGEPEPITSGYHGIRGKDRLRLELQEAGLTTLLRPAAPQAATCGPARLRLPSGAGAYVLELAAESGAPPQALPAGREHAVAAAPSLSVAGGEGLKRMEAAAAEALAWSSSSGWCVLWGDGAAAAASALAEAAAEHGRLVRAELRVTWREGGGERTLAVLEGDVVRGRPVCFACGSQAQALTGWDVEVAQGARIADPKFTELFSGVRGALTLDWEGGAPVADLDLSVLRTSFGGAEELLLGSELVRVGSDGAWVFLPEERVRVERPVVSEVAFRGLRLPLPGGRLALEREVGVLGGGPAVVRVEVSAAAP